MRKLTALRRRANDRSRFRSGFIKIASESTVRGSPQEPVRGAAAAAASTGLALEVHTEKGEDVEDIVTFLTDLGVPPTQLVLCHMDKRPDLALHCELARTGVVLEYDTFFRRKYEPEANLWPLIGEMPSAGLSDSLALATDMAEAGLWQNLGGGPGLCALVTDVVPRLQALGLSERGIRGLVGGNIARRLAGSEKPSSRS